MTEIEMIEAIRAKTETSYTIDGENGEHPKLVIVRRTGCIVAEYDKDDEQRMSELVRIYGVKV